jgi:hypothetical protein
MIRVGVTGTRHGLTHRQYVELAGFASLLQESHLDGVELHHGAQTGADTAADSMWARHGVGSIIVYPGPDGGAETIPRIPDDPRRTWRAPEPYLARNRAIVDAIDLLIALPAVANEADPRARRSGTWATVRYARRSGITTVLIYPS